MTAEQDMPNTVTEAQMRLRQDMHGSLEWQVRASTDPEWLKRQLSGPDIIERSWPLLWSVIATMLAGAAVWVGILWAGGWI